MAKKKKAAKRAGSAKRVQKKKPRRGVRAGDGGRESNGDELRPKEDELRPKEKAFVDQFVIDKNATKAAERAGYSARSAATYGHVLLKRKRVADAVQARLAEISELAGATATDVIREAGITAADVLRELALVAMVNISDYMKAGPHGVQLRDIDELPGDKQRQIASIKETFSGGEDQRSQISFKLHDKMRALEMLAKHFGLYKEADGEKSKLTLKLLVESATRELEGMGVEVDSIGVEPATE